MSEEAQEALSQLGDRLGLEASDTEKIFHGVVEERLREMMIPVRDAWEEATYTKEALLQLNKERGKDLGDDPTADGTGAELGIKDSPPLEGVRGFKLMEELTKVADFYKNNKVLKDDAVDSSSEDEDAWAAAYPVQVGKWIEDKNKEEMYGIFVWNAITCQDTAARDKWTAAKAVIGGILGLSPKVQQKVLVRMVSRWCNMFIKSKVQEQGELKKDDVSMLTDWAPMFFGIEKDVTMDMVQAANKSLLQNKVLKILNKPSVTPEDLSKLRAEVDEWDLEVAKDLELSRPQLRSLFRVEVASVVEDPDLSDEQKVDGIEASREAFGLAEKEAMSEMQDLIKSRCRSCLVNASGDLLQENEAAAVDQMQRLELLAAFGLSTGVEFQDDWEVAPAMRQKLVKTYAAGSKGRTPDTRMLERVLSLVHA
ncbi:TIC110 [Symbiodinium necroappetens]|uniref:TIC110 protein n=1 Tax=Symbiodinium necroappetens TaxID=1628268 RepID=A0A812NTY2_9DINO|nr:TIC110 [Symbiodinium necroappetens]